MSKTLWREDRTEDRLPKRLNRWMIQQMLAEIRAAYSAGLADHAMSEEIELVFIASNL